ncbi:MAG: 7-carboxy-7-deazaguanine synthase QueE [Silvanigrellaceae bacterium]
MSSPVSLLVNEIYPCLQGEGINLGTPSILVRLQICNLRCSWCDTPYTHTAKSDPMDSNDKSSKQRFQRMLISKIVEEISRHSTTRHVILSGGEPTLQNFSSLLEQLSQTHSIEVETNGTQIPHQLHSTFQFSHYRMAQWNISPKGRNAGEDVDFEALKHWADLSRTQDKVFFKFVVRQRHWQNDAEEIFEISEKLSLPTERILVMAEGTTAESQLNNSWLEKICLTRGWRMSPRLHVLIHGPRRGV